MEEQQLHAAFSAGIALPEGRFAPLYYLSRVDEPEFGCEGRPEQGKIYGHAYGFDAGGARQWEIEETALWCLGLDDGMWVGRWQGGYALLSAKGALRPLSEDDFAAIFGAQS